MSRIVWDKTGERFFETGTDRGVLFPQTGTGYGIGVPWNGLSAVTESPSGAEPTAIWADNIKYLNLTSAEEFGGTIEAYSSPEEFDECDGTKEVAPGVYIGQQDRKGFGFAYRTLKGNDVDGNSHGYKLHIVYGAKASPTERAYTTVNDSPEAAALSWEFTTTPVNVSVEGAKPTALLTIDSTRTTAEKLALIEEILYGKDATSEEAADGVDPRLPMPDEIITLLTEEAAG